MVEGSKVGRKKRKKEGDQVTSTAAAAQPVAGRSASHAVNRAIVALRPFLSFPSLPTFFALDLDLDLVLALAIIPIMSQDSPALRYVRYDSARENEYVAAMRQLISKDLSEPYSIYVYRYFLYQWGDLCFLAMDDKDEMVGVVVSKLEPHRGGALRGYIAMLAVREEFRGQGIATKLVRMAIDAMTERDADEVCIHPCAPIWGSEIDPAWLVLANVF